ncbi:MAG: hypothetical protein MJZ03_01335 [archaeon]|nr:hypothetical protein [archaeon]
MDVIKKGPVDLFCPYNPKMSSDSVVSFARMTGQDALIGCVHSPAYIIDQFDGEVKYSDENYPTILKHPLSSPSLLDGKDTTIKGLALGAIESYKLTKEKCPDLAVVGNVTGPLTKASVLMGMDTLSLAIYSDPDFVHQVINLGTEVTFIFLEKIRNYIDCVFVASASDNPDLFGIGPIMDFCVKNLDNMVKKVSDMEMKLIFHPHGNYADKKLIKSILNTHIDCFHYSEKNDPLTICQMIKNESTVMGGPDIIPTLYSGTNSEIINETYRHVDVCKDSRYIFSCSCSLHSGVPINNIKTMISAYRTKISSLNLH